MLWYEAICLFLVLNWDLPLSFSLNKYLYFSNIIICKKLRWGGEGVSDLLDNWGTLAFFSLKSVCVLLNINCVSKDYQRILIFPYCPGPLKISWFHQSRSLFNNWIVLNDIKSLWIESVWKEMKWWLCCLGTKARVIIGPTITGNNILQSLLSELSIQNSTDLSLEIRT